MKTTTMKTTSINTTTMNIIQFLLAFGGICDNYEQRQHYDFVQNELYLIQTHSNVPFRLPLKKLATWWSRVTSRFWNSILNLENIWFEKFTSFHLTESGRWPGHVWRWQFLKLILLLFSSKISFLNDVLILRGEAGMWFSIINQFATISRPIKFAPNAKISKQLYARIILSLLFKVEWWWVTHFWFGKCQKDNFNFTQFNLQTVLFLSCCTAILVWYFWRICRSRNKELYWIKI